MPIQPMQFPQIMQQSINPFQNAIGQGIGMYGGLQDALKASLQRQQLEAQLPYAGQQAQADAMYKMAMAKYLGMPNQMLKNLSPLGKTYVEPGVVNAYSQMNGEIPQNPMMQSGQSGMMSSPQESDGQIGDAYGLERQKLTTDSQARQRNLYASNIEKTLDFIDPDKLTQYAGVPGGIKGLYEKAKAGFGAESPEYDQYRQSAAAADFLAKQVRQFYGASIRPEMEEKLSRITNPSEWASNPKLAKQNFLQLQEILKREMSTYREAMKSTKPYGEQLSPLRTNATREQLVDALSNNSNSSLPALPGRVRRYNPQTGRIE